jgi:endoglucanase
LTTETTIAHAASHTNDAVLRSDPSTHLDLVGGWYNAGDLGKYSHMHAIAVGYMMLLHELWPALDEVAMNIPESGNGAPDLLDQARFGLQFLLKMQLPDGSVMHKVDSEPYLPYGILPEDDTYTRYASSATSIDTGDFVAVALQAARVFAKYDASFASRCHNAALQAWNWLEANPDIASSDAYYIDADPSQERLFALAAMVADGKDATLSAQLVSTLAGTSVSEVAWTAPELLSLFDVARLSGVDSTAAQAAKAKIVSLADGLVAKGQASGYRLLLSTNEIAWESVETALHRADALLIAYALTRNAAYHVAAIGQLDWVLGTNALDQSFVTSFGENSVTRPYHWIFASMGKVMPAWAVGGPNQFSTGADPLLIAVQSRGTPPAKCYVDEGIGGSWASNEGEVTDEAALLFATGWLYAEGLANSGGPVDAGADGGAHQVRGNSGLVAGGGGCSCRTSRTSQGVGFAAIVAALALFARRRRH